VNENQQCVWRAPRARAASASTASASTATAAAAAATTISMLYGSSTASHAKYGVAYAPISKPADFDAVAALERMLHRPAPPEPRRLIAEEPLPQHRPAPRRVTWGTEMLSHAHAPHPPDSALVRWRAPRPPPQSARSSDQVQDDLERRPVLHSARDRSHALLDRYLEFHRRPPLAAPALRGRRVTWETEMLSPQLQWIINQRAEDIRRERSVNTAVPDGQQETQPMTEQTQPSRSSVLKAVDGKHHASVQILVEVVCKVDSTGLGSTHHDQSKYDHYFDQVVAGLSGMVTSPLDPKHTIDVSVDKVSTAAAAPAAPFVGGPNGNGSRLGAFEVYLCTDLVDVETVPPCSGLHSKLHSRHWPNIKQLQARCNDVLLRVFHRWKRDVELRAAIPHIVEASGATLSLTPYIYIDDIRPMSPLTQTQN
jgi:hypothetical protein